MKEVYCILFNERKMKSFMSKASGLQDTVVFDKTPLHSWKVLIYCKHEVMGTELLTNDIKDKGHLHCWHIYRSLSYLQWNMDRVEEPMEPFIVAKLTFDRSQGVRTSTLHNH